MCRIYLAAKNCLIKATLLAGLLITTATSVPAAAVLQDAETRMLSGNETAHVVLQVSESVADTADGLVLTVFAGDAEGPEIRVVPDPPGLAIETFRGRWESLPNLMDHCPRRGACILGFSLELVDETQSVEITVEGIASEYGVGGLGPWARNGEFPTDATLDVVFDGP